MASAGRRYVKSIQIGEGYYLAPDGQVAAKPYKLLVQVLSRSSKVAVAKYAWSGRERLGLLRIRDDVIVLHAMRWPDEIRAPGVVDPPHETVSEEEIAGALALMESKARDDLDGYECADGWPSDSIGRQGACSHHGGVVSVFEGDDGTILRCGDNEHPPRPDELQQQIEDYERVACVFR
ncbi:Ku protein [Streptomyces sp. NBC_00645]|uniref:Ku protein n=1 Tax=Streptomyces sp. NBC_00645 TaxID=2975795 RepID=UPI0038651798